MQGEGRNMKTTSGIPIFVYVTAPTSGEAKTIARAVVSERLAACANLLGPIHAVYRWRGKVEEGREWVLILKTQASRWEQLTARIRALHSYDVPCIVALPIVKGHAPFIEWVRAETAARGPLMAKKRGR